jgi:hypothetical protein
MKLLLATLLLTGCVTTTYKPFGSGGPYGGYQDQKIGQDKYIVSYDGNNWDDPGTIKEFAYRRVREVCEGDYEVLSTDTNRRPAAFTYEITVKCKE